MRFTGRASARAIAVRMGVQPFRALLGRLAPPGWIVRLASARRIEPIRPEGLGNPVGLFSFAFECGVDPLYLGDYVPNVESVSPEPKAARSGVVQSK